MMDKWGTVRMAREDPRRRELARDLAVFHDEWQQVAREEVYFLAGGNMSEEVGMALQVEHVHPASLVIGRNSGKPKFFQCSATKWCVRRLQEAANGWKPSGGRWWNN